MRSTRCPDPHTIPSAIGDRTGSRPASGVARGRGHYCIVYADVALLPALPGLTYTTFTRVVCYLHATITSGEGPDIQRESTHQPQHTRHATQATPDSHAAQQRTASHAIPNSRYKCTDVGDVRPSGNRVAHLPPATVPQRAACREQNRSQSSPQPLVWRRAVTQTRWRWAHRPAGDR